MFLIPRQLPSPAIYSQLSLGQTPFGGLVLIFNLTLVFSNSNFSRNCSMHDPTSTADLLIPLK